MDDLVSIYRWCNIIYTTLLYLVCTMLKFTIALKLFSFFFSFATSLFFLHFHLVLPGTCFSVYFISLYFVRFQFFYSLWILSSVPVFAFPCFYFFSVTYFFLYLSLCFASYMLCVSLSHPVSQNLPFLFYSLVLLPATCFSTILPYHTRLSLFYQLLAFTSSFSL